MIRNHTLVHFSQNWPLPIIFKIPLLHILIDARSSASFSVRAWTEYNYKFHSITKMNDSKNTHFRARMRVYVYKGKPYRFGKSNIDLEIFFNHTVCARVFWDRDDQIKRKNRKFIGNPITSSTFYVYREQFFWCATEPKYSSLTITNRSTYFVLWSRKSAVGFHWNYINDRENLSLFLRSVT